jgi:hypothetical protein
MKTIALALFTLALALPLRADVGIQNGDFSDGISHWHGDARSPADFASDNPMAAPDPITSKGMIIPLKHTAWSKVEQDFDPGAGTVFLTVTYMFSPDLVFSTKDEDYKGMPDHLGWGWKTFDIPTGSWMLGYNDSTGTKGMHDGIKLGGTPGKPQTIRLKIQTDPHDKTTFTIAIPPGTGDFIILNVSSSETQ